MGNHPTNDVYAANTAGSSPRPWGTLCEGEPDTLCGRFIPTPVGNTFTQLLSESFRLVHPHARGEHIQEGEHIVTLNGSSPRPWGTLMTGTYGTDRRRFIPTPVGNTSILQWIRLPRSVHPHARGEHGNTIILPAELTGSSPRPWGTPTKSGDRLIYVRFIPTPVGNTFCSECGRAFEPVHPHARGEHGQWMAVERGGSGSSPRPWGTSNEAQAGVTERRFIPTPVGNTGLRRNTSRHKTVHPHARGEHCGKEGQRLAGGGSSPRPWGTLVISREERHLPRFIPTPVGNTQPPARCR